MVWIEYLLGTVAASKESAMRAKVFNVAFDDKGYAVIRTSLDFARMSDEDKIKVTSSAIAELQKIVQRAETRIGLASFAGYTASPQLQ